MKRIAFVIFLLFLSKTAFAEAELRSGIQAATPDSEALPDEDPWWTLRIGAKGTLTGALWSQPDEVPPGSDPFWGDTQFFVGGGGGLFVEGNLFGYVGLELDLLFEANSFTFNQTYTVAGIDFEYDYDTRFNQLRVPILIKGTLPLGGSAEMSLGLGPEFVIGTSASVGIDRRTDLGNAAVNDQVEEAVAALYRAEKSDGTFFDFDLGVGIKVWRLIIPVSLRIGINLNQPAQYADRVAIETAPLSATVDAVESYNFALIAGVGYLISP